MDLTITKVKAQT